MINLRKLIFAPCFLSLLTSCGKKVESTDPNANNNNDGNPIILPGESSSKRLSVNFSDIQPESNIIQYQLKGSAWVRIPEFPRVLGGNATTIATRVRFNILQNSISLGDNEVYCDYFSIRRTVGGSNGNVDDQYDHHFKGCFEDVDRDGVADELNFIPGDEIGVLKDRSVQLQVSPDKSTETLVLESEIDFEFF